MTPGLISSANVRPPNPVAVVLKVAQGSQGPQGDSRPPVPPGEVTSQQLSDAISGVMTVTSANSNAVQLLDPEADQARARLRKVSTSQTEMRW